MIMKEKIYIMLYIFPAVIFLLIWQIYSYLDPINVFLFSNPYLVIRSLYYNTINGLLIKDFFVTGFESLSGFVLGNIFGVIIGLSLWLSNKVAEISKPYIIIIGAIPIFSLAPMMIIWFGTGLFAKVMMAMLSTFIVAVTQAYEGVKHIDERQIALFKTMGAKKQIIFTKLVVPSSLLWVFNSLKLNVSFALLGAFIGEFISAESGLGYRILKAGGVYDVSLVLAALVYMIFLAFIYSFMIGFVEKKVIYLHI